MPAFVGSSEEILFAPAIGSKVVGTAGAGGAFAATFTAYVVLSHPIREALWAATINSASVVGHIDSQTRLFHRQELDQRPAVPAQSAIRRWQYSARKSEKVLLGIKAHFGKLVILWT
jgi:ribokinase